MSGPLYNHFLQFLLGVSERALSQHKDSFFIPTIPSLSFGLDEIINKKKLIEKLQINEIPSANPIFWPHQTKGDIENKIKEFFDNYELNDDQMSSTDYEKEKEVTKEIQRFDRQIQELFQKIQEKSQNSQELGQIDQNENIIKLMKEQLEELQAKKKDYINSNLSSAIENYKSIFQNHQQNNQMNKSGISIVDSKKIQIYQSENLTFSEYSYSSQGQEAFVLQEDTHENKVAQSLKGFGLGKKQSQDKLEKSIEESFQNLNIECEYSHINFERNWMPLDLFSNENIGLRNKEKSQWSNGMKHDQDQFAEFPYTVVGAVFCKNLLIKGFKSDESTKNILQEMKNQQSESYCLIFNCQEDMPENSAVIVSEDSINIKSLRVLGLILCPLQSFPKLVCQEKQFPLKLATQKIFDYLRDYKEDEVLIMLKKEQEISKFTDWQQKSSQIIEKLKNFPKFKNYEQKKQFINKYKENKIDQDLTKAEKTINALYKGLNSQMIREFKILADDFEILTNNLESVSQEEISELQKIFQDLEQKQEKINFKDLSKKFFTNRDTIQKIYENMKLQQQINTETEQEINPQIENLRQDINDLIDGELTDEEIIQEYCNQPDISSIQNWQQQIQLIIQQLKAPSKEQTNNHASQDEQSNNQQILQIFSKFSDMNEQDLKSKLQKKSSELVTIMYDIFQANPDEYSKIKKACQQQKDLNFLLDNENNEIESFFNNINNPKKLSKLDVMNENPILCLKILQELLRKDSQIIEQQQEDQDILKMNEKFTEIIETNSPNNLIDVFVKALLLQKQTQNQNKAEAQQNYEQFEQNLRKNYSEQDISNFKQQFDLIEAQNLNEEDKQAQINNLIKNQINKIEENDFKKIKYFFEKDEKIKFYQQQQELSQTKDLESLSQIAQTPIALHYKSNLCEYKIYGEQYVDKNNMSQIVNLVIDNQNNAFFILNILPSNQSHISINGDEFKKSYEKIYNILQPWLQTFLGYKSLFPFIYDNKQKCCNQKNVEILKNLVQQYELFEKDQNFNFQSLKNVCTKIQNQQIFIEWFKSIQQTDIGQKFAEKFEILWARSNVQRQILIQSEIKAIFQGFQKILDLKDFNRLRGRKDFDSQKQDLQNSRDDGNRFMNELIQQMFGYIIRREDIQKLVDHLKEIQTFQKISVRFLISLVLQYSNIELRQRLFYYLSEYYSVPLIIICQNQYLNGRQNLVYLPEIAFEMLEGIGIFNFGAGKRCLQFCGKSQLMNDMLFPEGKFSHQAFDQNDENIFTNGQVDVFFEKSYSQKRQIVVMDGQGSLCNQEIQSVSKLTNIAIINFSFEEVEELDSLRDLLKKIEIIKQQNSDSIINLVLRDATSSQQQNQKLSNIVKNKKNIQLNNIIEEIDKKIDFCILLENMSLFEKLKRLNIISPILQLINQQTKEIQQSPQKFKFTKNNFIENFLSDEEENNQRTEIIKQVLKISKDFIDQVDKIKDDIYQDNALPILKLKQQIREQILEIRNNITLDGEIQENDELKMDLKLQELKEKIQQTNPTQILIDFKNIVQIQDGNRSLILYEIQKELRKITQQQLKDPIDRKTKLNKQKEEAKQIKQFINEEKQARIEQYEKELQEINDDILKRSISLEHFWRCLVFYMDPETNFPEFNDKSQKEMISRSIGDILKNGDCFELIDGENLEFKGKFVQEVINKNRKDKVLVVCVIGPQSSGKSTLMNFSFGTQFFASSGRCTKGIYFTLQKFPSDIPNSSDVDWLLMLDTEGLQSPDRLDKEYDRKIVLFAMLSANVVIINSKGEINSEMIETLKMCCLTFDQLKQHGGITPQIIYTNGQNNDPDIEKISQQVQGLKPKVIEASNSATIEKTAEEILGYNDDKIIIFGNAYNSQVFQQEKMRGLDQNISFQLGNTQFGVETSLIFKKICEMIKENKLEYFELSKWLDDQSKNWMLIDKFSGDINAFANLDEFRNDQKVKKKILQLWENYLKEIKMDNDTRKITQKKIELLQTFKKNGKYAYDKKIEEVDKENCAEKEQHLQKHIFEKFESWMQSQKGITIESKIKYYKIIQAKMDQEKIDFIISLQGKIKEDQMDYLNETQFIQFQEKSEQLKPILKDKSEQEQEILIKEEFDKGWDKYIQEIKKEYKLQEQQKSQFINLLQSFRLENSFIQLVGPNQYNELIERIESQIKPNDFENLISKLEEFIATELSNKSTDKSDMFNLDNKFHFMEDDYLKRLFNEENPEKYLKLQKYIKFDYQYTVISDMNNFEKEQLAGKIIKILSFKQQKNFNIYNPVPIGMGIFDVVQYSTISDSYYNQSNLLETLIQDLSKYGFVLEYNEKLHNYCWDYNKDMQDQDIYKICQNLTDDKEKQKFAKLFTQKLKFDQTKQKQNIKEDLLKLFKQKQILIQNRLKLNEKLNDHIDYLKQIFDGNLQFEDQISNNYCKETQNTEDDLRILQNENNVYSKKLIPKQIKISKFNQQQFNTLISPVMQECDMVKKKKNLSYIALNCLDFDIISKEIIQNVQLILNFEDQNQQVSDPHQDVNIQNRIEQVYMTPLQIQEIQNKRINILSDQIEQELMKKLGLNFTVEMRAKISWCTLLTCWIMIYKKSQLKFNHYLKYIEKQKEQQFEIFKDNALGKSSKNFNIQLIIKKCLKNIEDKYKPIQQDKILKEIDKIKTSFDTLSFYQKMDYKYLISNDQNQNIQIQYAENQIIFFEKDAQILKQDLIEENIIIEKIGAQSKYKLQENLQKALNLFDLLSMQKQKRLQNQSSAPSQFEIKIYQSDCILNFDEKQKLLDSFSPVIYQVLINILTGNATGMNKILFNQIDLINKSNEYITLIDNNGKENKYEFTILKDGPLEIFTEQEFNEQIKNSQSCELITEILDELKQQQYQKDAKKLYEIDKIISSAIDYLKQELIDLQNKNFDLKFFECNDYVDSLCNQAVGCNVQCSFCKRKCEHNSHKTNEKQHSCDTVGHQQRVFSGGQIKLQDGTIFPSLRSCDNKQSNNEIKIEYDNIETIKQLYASQWSLQQQGGKNGLENFKINQKIFSDFWQRNGQKYCEGKGIVYLKDQDLQDKILQGKIYQSSIEVIILDESLSMWFFSRWTNAVNGAKQYIEFMRNNHIFPDKVYLIIIFFSGEARIAHQGPLNDLIDEKIWERKGYDTEFGKPLEMAIQQINQKIEFRQMARINFFTDGQADFPEKSTKTVIETIRKNKDKYLRNGKQKLQINLMCSYDKSKMIKIEKELNLFSQNHLDGEDMCQVMEKIDPKVLGNKMIETFINLKIID